MKLEIFFVIFVIICPDMIFCEKAGDVDILASYKRDQQIKNRDTYHSDHLYITLKLDEILDLMKESRKPADDLLHETIEKLEQRFDKVSTELKDVKDDLTNVKEHLNAVKEDLNGNRQYTNSKYHELKQDVKDGLTKFKEDLSDNRQYTNSKYHELRQDVKDINDNTNAKHHELRQDLTDTDVQVQQLRQSVKEGTKISGTTYIRWGRTTCPANGSVVTYTGFAGGSWYDHIGGAASMLCLPEEPDWDLGKYSDTTESSSGLVYGAEYQDGDGRSYKPFGDSHHDQDVPCVVCNVRSRSSHLMIPGKTRCPAGWTMEYYGYLMSGYYNQGAATDYYCIDMKPENVPGGQKNENGRLLYFVESRCVSLKCPPYVNGRELPCVVCTK